MSNNTVTMTFGRKIFLTVIVTFSTIVLLIPYLAYDFYNQFLETYNVTDTQMGLLLTAYGMSAVPSYFIGGWIADIFDPKKLVIASCVSTGLIAFGVAASSSYYVLIVLFFLFGISAITLNWSAYLKIVKGLGEEDEQGRLFGVTDVAYYIMSLVLQYAVLALVTYTFADNPNGFKIAYVIYGALSILVGIATQFMVPKMNYEKEGHGIKADLELLGKAAKLPVTWYLAIFTLGYFFIRSIAGYFNPYMTDAFEQSVPLATAVGAALRNITLIIFSPLGGYLRDKAGVHISKLINWFSLGVIVFSGCLYFIPQGRPYVIWLILAALLLMAFNSLMSNYLYTMVTSTGVPVMFVGSVYGIASAIGYSSDLWLYTICGNWLDTYGNEGYRYIWLFGVLGGIMMLAIGFLIKKKYKDINNK